MSDMFRIPMKTLSQSEFTHSLEESSLNDKIHPSDNINQKGSENALNNDVLNKYLKGAFVGSAFVGGGCLGAKVGECIYNNANKWTKEAMEKKIFGANDSRSNNSNYANTDMNEKRIYVIK